MINNYQYWEKSIPFSFFDESVTYEQKRNLRYSLTDIPALFDFDIYRGKRVLEIGSGAGIDSVELSKRGAEVVAIDVTDRGIFTTKEMAKEAGVSVKIVKCEGDRLSFIDESFDAVYCYGVLHHIREVNIVVDEIKRVLKFGGSFIGMVYNKNSLLYAYSILFLHRNENLSDDQLAAKYSERNIGCPYTKVYTELEVHELLKGFSKIEISVTYDVIDTLKSRKVKLGIPNLKLGWHIIFKCKRGRNE